jgi:hypothetical protein
MTRISLESGAPKGQSLFIAISMPWESHSQIRLPTVGHGLDAKGVLLDLLRLILDSKSPLIIGKRD